mgnify:FL=1
MKILVTGSAGFIGFHVCKKLIKNQIEFLSIDNLNNYYCSDLKKARLRDLENKCSQYACEWNFVEGDIINMVLLYEIFKKFNPDTVIHLAAQAGVRYSISNPESYTNSNLLGFSNILECCRNFNIKNFIYASSSSVYGGNTKIPFSESDTVDHPISLYAATKKSNEIMAHAYSHLYNIPSTGLRFFTVYGPWGRPDMAPMIFTKSILSNNPLTVFNNGDISRDFTYIDDVVEIIFRLIKKPAQIDKSFDRSNPQPHKSWSPHRIYNIGNSNPISIMEFIESLEKEFNIKSKKIFKPMQPGDVQFTAADTSLIENLTNFKPNTSISKGIKKFATWYRNYYKL